MNTEGEVSVTVVCGRKNPTLKKEQKVKKVFAVISYGIIMAFSMFHVANADDHEKNRHEYEEEHEKKMGRTEKHHDEENDHDKDDDDRRGKKEVSNKNEKEDTTEDADSDDKKIV